MITDGLCVRPWTKVLQTFIFNPETVMEGTVIPTVQMRTRDSEI